jgi:serine/threonine protein kinase
VSLTGKHLGPYQLLDVIGTGGMGTVYRAERTDGQFQKQVAIKVVPAAIHSPELQRRFSSEQQILASLEHPNIARLYDAGVSPDGIPYFVMEYVEGVPINQYCDAHDLGTTERLKLFQTVCEPVQYAHQHLVVHRDLKPGNILVRAEGVPKLIAQSNDARICKPGASPRREAYDGFGHLLSGRRPL